MKIAIIGAGVAGINVLKYLTKQKKLQFEITVYDDQKYLGNGRAFQYDDSQLLMNYPGNQISLKPNKPGDFTKWVDKNEDKIKLDLHTEQSEDNPSNEYYSRQLFGKYMEDHMAQFTKKKYVTTVEDHVRNIVKVEGGFEVSTQNDTSFYDAVFLTIGQFGPQDPYKLKDIETYHAWPYPIYTKEFEAHKDVAVLGTGLSAMDIVRHLVPQLNTPLKLVSRNGQLQSVRGEMADINFKYITLAKLEKIKAKNNGFLPLEDLKALFLKEVDHHNIKIDKLFNFSRKNQLRALQFDLNNAQEVGNLQSFILKFTQMAIYMWPFMTRADKAQYTELYSDKISAYSNPMPETTARYLINALQTGKVEIIEGIEKIEYKYNKFRLHTTTNEYRVHYVINATGPAKHFKDALEPNPLIQQLLNQDLLIEHPDGGFYVQPITNEVLSAQGVLDNLYLIGQKSGGVNYLNNGIIELIDEAKRSVKSFAQKLK